MLDDLVSVIETLQQHIRNHGASLRENETRTRMALIDPLLTALGWDVSDPALVTPEYSVSGRWADYALLRSDRQPAATIEAKKLGESLASHRMQMLNYSNASGVEYAGLTDGDHWELYEVFQRGQLEDRRILDVSIANLSAHELALKLLLLWRPNLSSGRLTAVEPKPMEAPVTKPALHSPAVSTPATGWVAMSSFTVKRGTKHPTALKFLDGTEYTLASWRQLLLRTAEWLVLNGSLTSNIAPVLSGTDKGNAAKGYCIVNTEPMHPNGERFAEPRLLGDTSLVVNVSSNSASTAGNAKILLQHCGISPDTVWLKVEP